MSDLLFRPMTDTDLKCVAWVDNECFRGNENWSEKQFRSALLHGDCGAFGVVVLDQSLRRPNQLCAFGLFWMSDDAVNVWKLGVDWDHRRRGIAKQIVSKQRDKVLRGDIDAVRMLVPERNDEMLRLALGLGFRGNGVIRDRSEAIGCDAYELEYRIQARKLKHDGVRKRR